MNIQSPIVAGVFEQFPQARQAYLDLQAAGFADGQIGMAQQSREAIDLKQSFQRLGMSQEQADAYDQQYREGRIVVSVRSDGREQEAAAILQRNGAITDQSEGVGAADEVSNVARPPDVVDEQDGNGTGATRMQDDVDGEQVLRLREEHLQVDKQKVQVGQVLVHKEIVTEQKTITVPVTHEEVVIEHRAVESNQIGGVAPVGDEETIRIPVSEEQVSITKRPVVMNEVVIGKREVQETRHVSDTVRREEASIDHSGDVPIHDTTDSYTTDHADAMRDAPDQ